jgi:hypothetical protein
MEEAVEVLQGPRVLSETTEPVEILYYFNLETSIP